MTPLTHRGRTEVRAARRPPATPPARATRGTIVHSRATTRRARIAAWWRYRPQPIGVAVLILLALYGGVVLWAMWFGPWSWMKTVIVLASTAAVLNLAGAALWWTRRWRRRHP